MYGLLYASLSPKPLDKSVGRIFLWLSNSIPFPEILADEQDISGKMTQVSEAQGARAAEKYQLEGTLEDSSIVQWIGEFQALEGGSYRLD